MTAIELSRQVRRPVECLYAALVDPARRERAMALVLTGYAAVWWLVAVVSKSSQDIHYDMAEMFSWANELAWGTPKHPPFGAFLVRVWFSVMPAVDWAFYLLAVLLPTAALWIVWQLSARYLTPEKRVLGIALLSFMPYFNIYAFKYNANTVLVPLWALTTWWFLISFEMRRAVWGVLAGAAAGAAMLGKYWTVVLFAGLGLAALTDPRHSRYFRSPAPWLTIAIGVLLLVPHVMWLAAHDFAPFDYATGMHSGSFAAGAISALRFLLGTTACTLVPVVLAVTAARPGGMTLREILWPAEQERRTLVIAFAVPFVLPVLAAVLLPLKITSLWSMSAMTLFPIVLLSSPRVVLKHAASVRVLGLALAWPLLMAAASPAIAWYYHLAGAPDYEAHYRLIAQAVQRTWAENTDAPLRIVGSTGHIANALSFYLPGDQSTYDTEAPARSYWVDEERIAREGMAVVCPERERTCMKAANAIAAAEDAAVVRQSVSLSRSYFGTFDTPVRYEIIIVPPRGR